MATITFNLVKNFITREQEQTNHLTVASTKPLQWPQ